MYLPNKIFVEPEVTKLPLAVWQKMLLSMADYIETNGWCQYIAFDGDKSCLVGAYIKIKGWDFRLESIYNDDYIHPLQMLKTFLGQSPNIWNDQPGRTKEEVILALRTCAKEK